MAFVLAGSAADFTTGTGYAVVYGNSSAPNSLKLVRYTAGLSGPATLRTLVAVSGPAGASAPGPAATVRVLYAPDEDNLTYLLPCVTQWPPGSGKPRFSASCSKPPPLMLAFYRYCCGIWNCHLKSDFG